MKKVITYGTFDLFHKGHYNILKRAKELGDYLIVGVTGESYDIERGKLNVRDSLLTRIRNVEKSGFADEIIVEEYQGQKINDIRLYEIDTFVVGSDWRGKFDYLSEYCEVVYLERTKNISSTQIRESSGRVLDVGIVADAPDDGGLIKEALYVSGVHVKSMCSSNRKTLALMRERFDLDAYYSDYSDFLKAVDVVYVNTDIEKRLELVERAVSMGKHVIAEPPFTLDPAAAERIFALAGERGAVVTERLTLAFLRAFTQLVWFLHGGIIGEIVSARFSRSAVGSQMDELLGMKYALAYAALKVMNTSVSSDDFRVVARKVRDAYEVVVLSRGDSVALLEVGSGAELDDGLVVFGTDGRIRVPGDWWNIGYFEILASGDPHPKRYSFNFEGNGFRYLLQDLLISIDLDRVEVTKLSFSDIRNAILAMVRIGDCGDE